jgi:hypothetical protein
MNTRETFAFLVGYHLFHSDQHMNFQLNRWYSLGYWTKAYAEGAGAAIRELGDWKPELVTLAERMTAEEHAQNHCQIANLELALDVIRTWVVEKGQSR